jgi:NTP pyrophosphatase (non-canonical NTP hydrolase)
MLNLKKLQKKVWENKVKQGFNTTDVDREFNFIHSEVAEAFQAYRKKLPEVGEELADVVIFLLGLAEMLKIDLEKEIERKVEKNKKRVYKNIKGVTTRIKD